MDDAGIALLSKSKYAALRNVSRARVTQWISEGKIEGDALVGEGSRAKIKVAVADMQLCRTLNLGSNDVIDRLRRAEGANRQASKIIKRQLSFSKAPWQACGAHMEI